MSEEKTETKVKVPIITKIQNELKAPKGQWNNFGKYYYRNSEDIEQAVKPLLEKYGAQLTFDEDLIPVGNRIYVQVTANYKDSEQELHVKGHAREEDSKKGMDGSQITGSSSSYATKYALGKLFLIDDTKDADSQDNRSKSTNRTPRRQSAPQQSLRSYTKEELEKAKVNYNGVEMRLATIYEQATKGTGEEKEKARKWWTDKYRNPQTEVGNLVVQANKAFSK